MEPLLELLPLQMAFHLCKRAYYHFSHFLVHLSLLSSEFLVLVAVQ
jgi:hypothetical protein